MIFEVVHFELESTMPSPLCMHEENPVYNQGYPSSCQPGYQAAGSADRRHSTLPFEALTVQTLGGLDTEKAEQDIFTRLQGTNALDDSSLS